MFYYSKFSSDYNKTLPATGKILAIFDWIKPTLVPNYFKM